MKKRMKQTGALLLTLAMILSLSVTAFATVVGTPGNSDTNTVTSEGPPPADLTTVVLPTAASNQFNMYFDTFGMILETEGDRYASLNSNKGIEEIEDSRFYFLNNVTTGADLTDALAVDFGTGDTLVKVGTKVVKYTKAAATGGLTKIYAKPDTWVKVSSSNAVDTVDADWAASGAYEKIASLKSLDPKSGAGLDAIAALNKSDPDLYLTVGATALDSTAATTAGSSDLVGCFEYTFVASYSDYDTTPTDTCFVLFKDDGTVDKVFATKGTAEHSEDMQSVENGEESKDTQPVEDAEPSDGTQPVENAEPSDDTEPVENVEPSDVTESIEDVEPSDDTQPVENAEPSDVMESVEDTEPSVIAEPVEDAEPSDVAEPVEDAEPSDVAEPVGDTKPSDVAESVEDAEPSDVAEPVEDTEPSDVAEPVEDAEPSDVAEPTEDTEPSDDIKSVEDAEPSDLTESVEDMASLDDTQPVKDAGAFEDTEPVADVEPSGLTESIENAEPSDDTQSAEDAEPSDVTEPVEGASESLQD